MADLCSTAHPAPSSDAALLAREQRDAQSLASLLAKERARFEFLHSTNRDAEGWEWGVARVRVVDGKVEYLWGASDHSDIDAIIAAHPANGPQAGDAAVLGVLADVLDEYDRNTCTHENTKRGGAIWTICEDCGAKWADDRGGFKPCEDSPKIAAARAILAAAKKGTPP